jgi:hypothetical protein
VIPLNPKAKEKVRKIITENALMLVVCLIKHFAFRPSLFVGDQI